MKKTLYAVIVVITALYIYGCGSTKELTSHWSGDKIKVDGNQEDWEKKLNYDSDEGIAYGFCNDDSNLYVCLTTGNRQRIFQIIRAGFIVWFEPVNTDGKMICIKYPVGVTEFSEGQPENEERNPDDQNRMENRITEMINNLQVQQNEFLIMNKEKFPLTAYPFQNKVGIDIKVGYHLGQFVYEMKIPLKGMNENEYGVYANPGDIVKVGFQTEEFERSNFGDRGSGMGGERPEGGFGGFGGRGGMGGGRGMDRGNAPQQLKQLDYWVKLNLLKNADEDNAGKN
jgi:hypothetical protein